MDNIPVFVHASDLHLGSPLGGLGEGLSEGQRQGLLKKAEKAFDNLIAETIRVNAEFLVVAGDIYDSGECEPYIRERFASGVQQLLNAGVGVYLIHGNHDPATEKRSKVVALPDGVKVFAPWTPIDGDPTKGPIGTVEQVTHVLRDGRSVIIAGVSYRSDKEPHNLTPLFAGISRGDSCAVIGILHTGSKGGKGSYAPCTPKDLESRPVDYWALGHIHKWSFEQMAPNRFRAYCGNPQGRDIGEPGAHGALVVPILSRGVGEPTFLELDEFRFFEVKVNCEGVIDESIDKLAEVIGKQLDALEQSKPLIVRLNLVGRSNLVKVPSDYETKGTKGALEQSLTIRMSSGSLNGGYVEEVSSNLLPLLDMKQLRERDDIVGAVIRVTEELDPIRLLQDELGESMYLSEEEKEQLRSEIRSDLIRSIVSSEAVTT